MKQRFLRMFAGRRRGDDRGSMPLAMLVSLVGVGLSATLTSVVVTRIGETPVQERDIFALHAAQAGLDVGLAQVRGATATDSEGKEYGDRKQLPCTAMAGEIGGGNDASYSVQAAYYLVDPQGQNATWLAANAVKCLQGSGPEFTPAYVMFTATGKSTMNGKTTKRTLSGTYIMHTENTNIYGGLIHAYRGSTALNDLCISAPGNGDPQPGDFATMERCSSGSVSQVWAYDDTLQIQLVASQRPGRPYGMCLEVPYTRSSGKYVVLQPCQLTTPSLYRQQWNFNDNANLVGSKSDGSNTDGYCFNLEQPNVPGSKIIISNASGSCGSPYNNVKSFSPDSNVGAGLAASEAGQRIGMLVNYMQFGRCLDVTGANVNASYMIAWPCKQNPNPEKILWNQRYAREPFKAGLDGKSNNHVDTTLMLTYTNGVPYCVQSPGNTAYQQYVVTKTCVDKQKNQQWTVYGKTDQYATSYQIVDAYGYCLTPRNPEDPKPDLYQEVNKISKIYVAKCDGSTLQKWNADKNVIAALALKDLKESK